MVASYWIALLTYSLGIGFFTCYLLRRGIKSGAVISVLLTVFLIITTRSGAQLLGIDSSVPITFSAILVSILAVFGVLEYAYKNREKSRKFFSRKNLHYSFYAGWLHLVFAFCMYVLVYGPEYASSSLLTLKFFSGVAGCFILGALPVYLYLEKNMKMPAFLTSGWIVWGVYGFITSMDSYPVSMFFPPPEFILPPAPGYFFSNFIPVSVIVVYAALVKIDTKFFRFH